MNPDILNKLASSKFRSKFKLNDKEKNYIKLKGLEVIKQHCLEFLNKKIKIRPENDGRQTPWQGHPCFKAQHSLALCCRSCLEKWHNIPENKILNNEQITYFSDMILAWIKKQL